MSDGAPRRDSHSGGCDARQIFHRVFLRPGLRRGCRHAPGVSAATRRPGKVRASYHHPDDAQHTFRISLPQQQSAAQTLIVVMIHVTVQRVCVHNQPPRVLTTGPCEVAKYEPITSFDFVQMKIQVMQTTAK